MADYDYIPLKPDTKKELGHRKIDGEFSSFDDVVRDLLDATTIATHASE